MQVPPYLQSGFRVCPQDPPRVLADERGVSRCQAGQVAGSSPHSGQPWEVCIAKERAGNTFRCELKSSTCGVPCVCHTPWATLGRLQVGECDQNHYLYVITSSMHVPYNWRALAGLQWKGRKHPDVSCKPVDVPYTVGGTSPRLYTCLPAAAPLAGGVRLPGSCEVA
jgi:hypothetical protein